MDGGGFVLNIATSSSAGSGAGGRPAKKKNSFRAKQTAKRAKLKASKATAKTQTRAPTSSSASKASNSPHNKAASKPAAAPLEKTSSGATKQQATTAAPAKPSQELKSKPTSTATLAKDSKASPAKASSLAKEPQTADTNDLSRFDSDDSDDDSTPAPVAVHSDSEEDNDDANQQDASEKRAALASGRTQFAPPSDDDDDDEGDDDDDGTEAKTKESSAASAAPTDAAAPKTFGTRRNPNKALYDPESFTKVRATAVDTTATLDRPLESTSSEKIFAAKTFESLQLHARIVQVLTKDAASHGFGFDRPTTVQVQSIPAVLSGRDVLVKSETGSGKTLSYLLPIVQRLQGIEPRVRREDGCLALILAPTRELCLQILETANKLIQPFVYLVPGAIIGGEKKKAEKARLRKGLSILIATPGRLADHLVNTQAFQYSKLQFLVLDEADRLLDMGFEKQITQILSIIDRPQSDSSADKPKRQNVLVSATINSGVQELAKMSLKKPLMVDADGADALSRRNAAAASGHENFSTPHQLMQHFIIVPAKARLVALTCFLRQELAHTATAKHSKVVVFLSTCDAVDFHYELFRKTAWPAGRKKASSSSRDKASGDGESEAAAPGAAVSSSLFGSSGAVFRLHGNIPQHERMTAFKNFCTSSSGVLLCTDVAARGLNLPTVQWIVQYDPPTETRDYVHRVGRTARSGNQGSSLLFLMPSESAYLDHLQKHGLTMAALSLEKTLTRVGKYGGFMRSNKKLPHEVVQSDLQFLYDQTVLADKELFALACQAFHSFVRSYATHTSDTRAIFHVRSLHFGHIAKSFALREPPASSKVRDTGRNAKKGTLQKRKERDEKEKLLNAKRVKKQREQNRQHAQQVSEFAD